MIVEVMKSFKVTDGKVYVGGTTIEVDSFGALHPDVQKELGKKSGFFRLIDGVLPREELEEVDDSSETASQEEPQGGSDSEKSETPPEESTEEETPKALPRKNK